MTTSSDRFTTTTVAAATTAAATRAAASATAAGRSPARLLTEPEVLAILRDEIAASSLAAVAKRYNLAASQISDVLYGRANLSERMVSRIGLKMHKFYERQQVSPSQKEIEIKL